MGLDTLYSNKVEEGIKRWTDNPGQAPTPSSFSTWSFLSAGAKGAPAGLLESTGTMADALSLFAAPFAATFGASDGANPAGVEAARQKMLKGNSFDPAAGDALRAKADTFLPDPQTSSHADQVIAGLTRGVTKAVASIATLGPIPGAVAFGVDEGNNAGQRLRTEGVDTGTAFKVGAVTGVANAVGAMIPMGGSTLAKTIGLAAVGGPGTFMAQEALSRKILADAAYKDQASLHDPLDPLGLTLSTVIPFGFGALHLRGVAKASEAAAAMPPTLASVVQTMESGGKRFGNDGQILQGPMTKVGTAKGEMQVVDSTNLNPGFGVKPAADNSPAERARVGSDYLAAMENRYGGDAEKAMAAYNAGPGALDKAITSHGEGWLAHMPAETQKYVAKGSKMLGERSVAHASSNPDVVDAARVNVTNAALYKSLPDFPTARVELMQASDEIAAGRMPEVQPVPSVQGFDRAPELPTDAPPTVRIVNPETKPGPAGIAEPVSARLVTDDGVPLVVEREFSGKYVAKDQQGQLVATMQYTNTPDGGFRVTGVDVRPKMQRQGVANALYDFVESSVTKQPMRQTGSQSEAGAAFRAARDERASAPLPAAEPRAQINEQTAPGSAEPTVRAPPRPPSEGTNSLPPSHQPTIESAAPKIVTEKTGPASIDSQRVAAIAEADPTMKVKLPGSDETITVSDALERARADAKEEGDYAQLIKAAVDCALSFGA